MPTWTEIQAAAHLENTRIVIRFPNGGKRNESIYFYHSEVGPTVDPRDYLTFCTDTGSETFRRLYSKGATSRTYNAILSKPWGAFQPIHGKLPWVEYQYVGYDHWKDLPTVRSPTPGFVDGKALERDPQALWRDNSPAGPPEDPPPLFFGSSGWRSKGITTITSSAPPGPPPAEPEDLEDPDDLLSPEAREALNRTTHPALAFDIALGEDDEDNGDWLEQLQLSQQQPTEPPTTSCRPRPALDHHQRPSSLAIPEHPSLLQHIPMATVNNTRAQSLVNALRTMGFDPDTSEHPIRTLLAGAMNHDQTNQAKRATAEELEDDRILQLGKLEADLNNFELTIRRSTNQLSDGMPPITLPGVTIQSPRPRDVFDDELLDELNTIAYTSFVAMSKAMIRKQLRIMENVEAEKLELLGTWTPTPDQQREVDRIKTHRSRKEVSYATTPVAGGIRTFVRDGHTLAPNPDAAKLHQTGQRTPGKRPGSYRDYREYHHDNGQHWERRQPPNPPSSPDDARGNRNRWGDTPGGRLRQPERRRPRSRSRTRDDRDRDHHYRHLSTHHDGQQQQWRSPPRGPRPKNF